MAGLRNYKIDEVKVSSKGSDDRPRTKEFGGNEPITVCVHRYEVRDYNNRRKPHKWLFEVEVPQTAGGYTGVAPTTVPRENVLRGLSKQSIQFRSCDLGGEYEGKLYAKMFLSNPKPPGKKWLPKDIDQLPPWLKRLSRRIHRKRDVASTKGNDGSQLVVVVDPEDHKKMIQLFFAHRVWPLREGFQSDGK